jgi:hypothetical protein
MPNLRTPIAAALAATLALASCASATAGSRATKPPASAPPGRTYVTAYSIDTDAPDLAVVVSGAVGDFGAADAVSPGHSSDLELKLTRGTFRLAVAALDRRFVMGTSHEPVFPRTCSTFVSVTGAVPVVPGSGTGLYRGITGSFTLTLAVNEVHVRPCTHSLSFRKQILTLSGAGTVRLR